MEFINIEIVNTEVTSYLERIVTWQQTAMLKNTIWKFRIECVLNQPNNDNANE